MIRFKDSFEDSQLILIRKCRVIIMITSSKPRFMVQLDHSLDEPHTVRKTNE